MQFCPSSSRLLRSSYRPLHSSARTCIRIGPPDPVSHFRPIIYDDGAQTSPRTPHPYSLGEFTSPGHTGDYELQLKLYRQQLDSFNHAFWTDSNSRFEAAKEAVLSSLPESSTEFDKECALSEFYKQWLMQESRQMNIYAQEWRRRNIEEIILAFRVQCHKFSSLVSSIFKFKPR